MGVNYRVQFFAPKYAGQDLPDKKISWVFRPTTKES